MSKKKLSPGAALARLRWDKPDADRNQPREAGKLGGRPKLPRCPHGMTQHMAEKTGHLCDDPPWKRSERMAEAVVSLPSRSAPISVAAQPVVPAAQKSIPSMILGLLQSDPGREWSAAEIVAGVNANEKSLRGALNRLAHEGKLSRASRGRYQFNPDATEVQRIVA